MTTPGNHRDTYIEECHRNFFSNYARGLDPKRCGAIEKHIGGLPGIVPVVSVYSDQPETARKAALTHLALTHPGPKMETAGNLIIDLLLQVLQGIPLDKAILGFIEAQSSPLFGHPFTKWMDEPDERIVGASQIFNNLFGRKSSGKQGPLNPRHTVEFTADVYA